MFRSIVLQNDAEAVVAASSSSENSASIHFFQRTEASLRAGPAPLALLELSSIVPGREKAPWKEADDSELSKIVLPKVNCVAFTKLDTRSKAPCLLAASLSNGQVFVYRISDDVSSPVEVGQLSDNRGAAHPQLPLLRSSECLSFSPCGKMLAASFGNQLSVFQRNAETDGFSLLLVCPQGHRKLSANIQCVAWSRCGQFLGSGAEDGTIVVYRRDATQQQQQKKHKPVSFSLLPFKSAEGQPEDNFIWELSSSVTSIDFGSGGDGRVDVLAGSAKGELLSIEIDTENRRSTVLQNYTSQIANAVAESSASSSASAAAARIGSCYYSTSLRKFTACSHRHIFIFDASSEIHQLERVFEHEHGVLHCATDPANPSLLLSCGALGRMYAWNAVVAGGSSSTQTSHRGRVESIAVRPTTDSSSVFSSSSSSLASFGSAMVATASEDGTVKLWAVVHGKKLLSTRVDGAAGVLDVKLEPLDDEVGAVGVYSKSTGELLTEVALKKERQGAGANSPSRQSQQQCSKCAEMEKLLAAERLRVAALEEEIRQLKK